jgi:anti-sigma B factor antagonist
MSSVPSVAKTHVGRCLVAAFSGDMDYLTGPTFRTEFLNLIDVGERFIVLDLAGFPFCDSAGLNAFWRPVSARMRPVRGWYWPGLQGQLRQLLKLAGVDRILDVYDTTEDAVTNLASHRGDNSRNERNISSQTRAVSPR